MQSIDDIGNNLMLSIQKIKTTIDEELFNEMDNLLTEHKHKDFDKQKTILKKHKYNNEDIKCYFNELKVKIWKNKIESIKNETWEQVSYDKIREKLYKDGFTITRKDSKKDEIIEDKYVVYKRSSSKSRTGQCLFIKENLYANMIKWSRLGIDFSGVMLDYTSLLPYESLVGSALEDTITIDTDNILIISDVDSIFNIDCNVIRKGDKGLLDSFEEPYDIKNSLFDGESLLESTYYQEGQSMILLRNHMFKSASFACNINQFLIDNCPEDINFNEWEINNMFGEPILAKNIHMICTPSSLKALKYYKFVGQEKKDMWNYWKEIIKQDGNIFGICKHEKESKRGYDFEGNIVQQMSYQMVNSLPATEDDIKELIQFEMDYVDAIKNDDKFYIDFLRKNATNVNAYDMFADMYERNNNISKTKLFRDYRKKQSFNYIQRVKSGKVRLPGDYCILLGNPIEYLYHAIGILPVIDDVIDSKYNCELKGNKVYTKLFPFNKEYVAIRNPHTSPSNILVIENVDNQFINDYFNLSKNIVCVNAINHPIQDILSSCDYDSDSVVIFNHPKMLELGKKCKDYKVCVNDTKADTKEYELSNENMYIIDKSLSESQKNIGRTVNAGQFAMSSYWHSKKINADSEVIDLFMKKVDIATVLSTICIDMAKKKFNVNVKKEISNVKKGLNNTCKPLFFRFINDSETINDRTFQYDTPMDYLYIQKFPNTKKKKNNKCVDMNILLEQKNNNNADRKQKEKVITYVKELTNNLDSIYAKYRNIDEISEDDEHERDILIDDEIANYRNLIGRLKINENTMYSLIIEINKDFDCKINLLNILYNTQRENFINSFKKFHKV